MTIILEPPRGTRDFYPPELRKEHWLFDKWRNISKSFSFEEYDAPVMEHASLWDKKSGSDILNEMFTLEKEGIQYTLRPEMTPSVSRMMINCYKSITMPARWFSIPQCWRYETTTRGRKREFYQWNVDIFGATPINSEIEILSIIIQFLESVKLSTTDVTIKISDRRILEAVFTKLNIDNALFIKVCNIIDKIHKLDKTEIYAMFNEINITSKQIDMIYELINIKNINELEKYIDKCHYSELKTILEMCECININKWIELDLSIVRGLSYYTGVIFEGFFKNSELKRAILGGGRYDKLISSFGGDPLPAIGFGMGDVVIMDILNEMKLIPECKKKINYIVIPFNNELTVIAHKIANYIRKNSKLIIETYINGKRLKNALEYANKAGVDNVIIILPDEWKQEQIIVKSMITSMQRILELKEFYKEIGCELNYISKKNVKSYKSENDIMGFSDSDN